MNQSDRPKPKKNSRSLLADNNNHQAILSKQHDGHNHEGHSSAKESSSDRGMQGGHNMHSGHGKHAGHTPGMFKRRFFVSLILTLPILYFSTQLQSWLGYQAIAFPGSNWINPVLGIILYCYGGWPFLKGAWREFHSQIAMMTLIALAITVAFIYSLAVSLGLDGKPFYWELATLIDIMLLGHWIEMASVKGASQALEELSTLVPNQAHRMSNDQVEDVAVSEIQIDVGVFSFSPP